MGEYNLNVQIQQNVVAQLRQKNIKKKKKQHTKNINNSCKRKLYKAR